MKIFFCFACFSYALTLIGCAGSATDRDFRSKVQSSTTTISGQYDPATRGTSGVVSNTLTFRDPSK